MTELHKSSSHVQMLAEDIIFQEVEKILDTKFEKNKKLYMANNSYTYIQPDFYSWEAGIVGEIFAQRLFNETKLGDCLDKIQQKHKFKYSLKEIVLFLLAQRLVTPFSKRKMYLKAKTNRFNGVSFSL